MLGSSGNAPLDGSNLATISLAQLPAEALETLQLVAQGGPFPYPQDGTIFRNRENRLPNMATGYYREHTVASAGIIGRGARRIITGKSGEVYYTDDHYQTFQKVIE
ncbi:ribonuclease domain-containing protein [Methylomagnum sp.]